MLTSRTSTRQAAQIIPTTRPVHLGRKLLALAFVLLLMAVSALAASVLTFQSLPEIHAEVLMEAEAAAFSAGRVTAMSDMSGAMADVYQQGRADALADQARHSAARQLGEVRP